jgi:hypothetical protein
MGAFFDYREVACPGCGHLNRRHGSRLLDGRYANQCDHCGVELATGRFSVFGAIQWGLTLATVYFFCSLIGVFVALIGVKLLGWLALGPRYAAVEGGLVYLGYFIGIAGGVAVAERQRRRGGFLQARRVVPDSPDAGLGTPEAAPGQPESHAAVRARTARHWFLGLGYVAGVVVGVMLAPPLLKAAGLDEWIEPMKGIGMVAGLAAGWAWGRWKYAPPA